MINLPQWKFTIFGLLFLAVLIATGPGREPSTTPSPSMSGSLPAAGGAHEPGDMGPLSRPAAIIHTISPDCVSAEQIARRYGYQGDWRDYMEGIREVNGWEGWPILHSGEEILVPTEGCNRAVPGDVHTPRCLSMGRR